MRFFVCSDLISFICPKLSNRMKHLNLILIILILSCCPLHPVYAFLDKDIRLLTRGTDWRITRFLASIRMKTDLCGLGRITD